MSVKKVYKSVAIGATIILVIIGVIIGLSTIFFQIIPVNTDYFSSSFIDNSSDIHSDYFAQIPVSKRNNSPNDRTNTPYSISSQYINLDPVKNIQAGDQIIISGVTNLEPGSVIILKITPIFTGRTDNSNSKTTFKSFLGLMGSIRILPDNKSVHHWTWVANSSELSPNLYEVTASFSSSNVNSDQISGVDFTGSSRFTLTQRSL